MISEENITVFYVDLYNYIENNYISQICIKRAKEMLPNCKFKIYTEKSPEFEEMKEKFKKYINNNKELLKNICFMADMLRIYILRNNKYYLYLDTDIFMIDNSILKYLDHYTKFSSYCFYCVWSGEKGFNDIVLNGIYNFYRETDYKGETYSDIADCRIFSEVTKSIHDMAVKRVFPEMEKSLCHVSFIDTCCYSNSNVLIIDNIKKIDKYSKDFFKYVYFFDNSFYPSNVKNIVSGNFIRVPMKGNFFDINKLIDIILNENHTKERNFIVIDVKGRKETYNKDKKLTI